MSEPQHHHHDDAPGAAEAAAVTAPPEIWPASGYARNLAGLVLVLGVVMAIAGIVLVINQLTQPGGEITVTVPDPAQVLDLPPPDGLPNGTALDLTGSLDTVPLEVSQLPAALRALTRAPMLLTGLLGLVAALLLRRVLLEVAAGRPFAPVVPRRLAGLATTVLALALLPQALDTLATVVVLEHLGHRGEGSPIGFMIFSLDLLPLVLAAGLGIAASVFRHGQRLTEDVDGLV